MKSEEHAMLVKDKMRAGSRNTETAMVGGLAGWLLGRLRRDSRPRHSLALLERISLAPRQSLALVEAEGRRFLVATSAEGAPAFYALDNKTGASRGQQASTASRVRVSW
jgi:flagellar biogenesis protein FliO